MEVLSKRLPYVMSQILLILCV